MRIPEARAAAGGKLTKYLEPLPVPGAGIVVATPSGLNTYAFTQRQIIASFISTAADALGVRRRHRARRPGWLLR
jgi:hypothetical protein